MRNKTTTKGLPQKLSYYFLAIQLLMGWVVQASIRLPGLVGNNMILQRHTTIPVWGWASPGEKIRIRFRGKDYLSPAADTSGKWIIKLQPMSEGGPYEMDIDGKQDHIHLVNILIGDVWLCSGQSNMVFDFNNPRAKSTYAADIASSANNQIRQILIDRGTASFPAGNCGTSDWRSASPQSLALFSAVGYFYALNLYQRYHVPIGLINSSYGGTIAEAWTSEEGLKALPQFADGLQLLKDTTALSATIQEARNRISQWNLAIEQHDKGLDSLGKPLWASPDLDISKWITISKPSLWDAYGFPNTAGVFWYRKEIELPVALAGKSAALSLGQIDDADITYLNGQMIGKLDNRDIKRTYQIPPGLLKAGKNILLIRIINYGGSGGMLTPDEVKLVAGQEVDMTGKWQIMQAAKMDNKPSVYEVKKLPSSLYNAMIAPLVPYALKGVLWYQGEYNAARAHTYRALFQALITDWRTSWQQDNLPFIYAQLPNFQPVYDHPIESDWAELREAQQMALHLPYTAMSVNIDLGEADDIHPVNKKDVGYRLALASRKLAYGEKKLIASGPVYRSIKIDGNKIILSFSGSQPAAKGGTPLKFFAVAGEDRKFKWGTAVIKGDHIEVSAPGIDRPVAVRYAWAGNPEGCNLYNAAGLPASPFRTDDWLGITYGK